jgi:hypothetical protein
LVRTRASWAARLPRILTVLPRRQRSSAVMSWSRRSGGGRTGARSKGGGRHPGPGDTEDGSIPSWTVRRVQVRFTSSRHDADRRKCHETSSLVGPLSAREKVDRDRRHGADCLGGDGLGRPCSATGCRGQGFEANVGVPDRRQFRGPPRLLPLRATQPSDSRLAPSRPPGRDNGSVSRRVGPGGQAWRAGHRPGASRHQ